MRSHHHAVYLRSRAVCAWSILIADVLTWSVVNDHSGLQVVASFEQVPFAYEDSTDSYQFEWPIRNVAIIGAGVGGLIAYRELSEAGFNVRIFERDDVPGGNWHYTEETPKKAPVPNADLAVGDCEPSLPPAGKKLPYTKIYHERDDDESFLWRRKDHRAPKPLWAGLEINTPSPIQQIRDFPWPPGTPWELPHKAVQRYLRAFASWTGVNANDNSPHVAYNTRVETVVKRHDANGNAVGWRLTLRELIRVDNSTTKVTWWNEDFDAVVVANGGLFSAPYVPEIDGLDSWAKRFPGLYIHSREYRRPETYANKTVLIVGAAISGAEIARELAPHAKQVIVSIRPDRSSREHIQLRQYLFRIPQNITIIGEIEQFLPVDDQAPVNISEIRLTNGTVLSGFDNIIFATGYRYSFPFLAQYHNSTLGSEDRASGKQPLVTDGTHMRSLYLDLFYIEEPTLGFIDVNIGVVTFTYAEYTALALAKVWSGKARLPNTKEMWRRHWDVVEERGGYGKHSLFLGIPRVRAMTRYFIAWLNYSADKYGGKQIDGTDENLELLSAWILVRYGISSSSRNPGNNATHILGELGFPDEVTEWNGVKDKTAFIDAWLSHDW